MTKLFFFIIFFSINLTGHTQEKAKFNCSYDMFSSGSFTGKNIEAKTKKTRPFSFTIEVGSVNKNSFSAKIVGNTGEADLAVIPHRTGSGYTFIEKTDIGNVMQTVIYTNTESAKGLFSVHSRHVADMNMASQYYGYCN